MRTLPRTPQASPPRTQRGTATLISTMVILMLMTMVVFFANGSVMFDRKTASNLYRSTRAQEAAQAGLDWALANLNSYQRITATCTASAVGTDRSFRDVYLDPDGNGNYQTNAAGTYTNPFSLSTPMCTFNAGVWSCGCPLVSGTATTVPACSSDEGCPTFRVGFLPVYPNAATPTVPDPTMVKIAVNACTNNPCNTTGANSVSDATVLITQVVKLLSGLSSLPAAAITAKGNVDFGSNAITATNTDPASNGITINAGGSITGFLNTSTLHSLPGTPPTASLVDSDTSLSVLTDDQMFMTYFGMTKDQFKTQATTTVVSCSGVCTSQMATAVDAGARTIWVEGNMTLNANAVYGSPTSPIVLVVNGNIELRGTMTIYGVVYCQNSTWDNTGGGNAQVFGAAISEGNFTATGTPDPTYDPNVLKNLNRTTGDFGKVPGAWRDF